ncbi:MAG: translesion error-prone DNA polymerase V autoproteolytic subunit [Pelagibacteraceae bacterium]|nr:translesion error-prone DNA polymerase V autoproteolytic subunit [Pelagibacteraceae bacterium]MBT5213810.1 translesion error-prone DNA polymerase V autoproteolytic subunit [Pelagibacteraceae bacterium]MBT6197810.1 translesion error-prone DNA polymerase V autoproteolytic subunit [Pelagibacteraceae bacterium]
MNEKNILSVINIRDNKKTVTPLFLDSVSAGFPSPATDYMENKLDLNEHLVKHPAATFIVKASGPSMIEAGISSGDLLIVDRSIVPRNNNIVIASIFGDLTVKKLHKKGSTLFLLSANNQYPSIEIKEEMECFLWGVVTYVIHKAITK